MPLSIRVLKRCIDRRIDSSLIKHLHFFDLQCLLIQFDIGDIQEYFRAEEKERLRKKGVSSVKDISGNDAIRFLRGDKQCQKKFEA